MPNCFVNTIVFVKDIDKSKQFYVETLDLKVIQDFNTIVFFDNHFVLHAADSIMKTVFKKFNLFSKTRQGRSNLLIYFESNNLVECYNKVKTKKVKFIHGIEKQAWGQNVFRFFDLDRHIIEVGEPFRIKEFKE